MLMYEEVLDWLNTNPTIQQLRKKAKELGIRIKKRMRKREIIKVMRDELEKRLSQATERPSSMIGVEEGRKEKISEEGPELPSSYGKDKLVLLAVNPHWLHAYWDLSIETLKKIEKLPSGSKVVLRLHDVTYIIFDGTNSHRTFEVGVDVRYTKNYYFNIPTSGADYLLELGCKTSDGKFTVLMRSNVCKAPKDSPSDSTKERWIDLRTRKKRVSPAGEVLVKPVERVLGSSAGPLQNVSPSGGGAFVWKRIRSGIGRGEL